VAIAFILVSDDTDAALGENMTFIESRSPRFHLYCLLLLAVSAATSQATTLLLDFGPSAVISGWPYTELTNDPAHVVGVVPITQTKWNTPLTNDSSVLTNSDGTRATGISLTLGRSTVGGTFIDFSDKGFTNKAMGGQLGWTGIYNYSAQVDGVLGGTNSANANAIGLRIDGLAAGTYNLYVTGRNTDEWRATPERFYARAAASASTYAWSALTDPMAVESNSVPANQTTFALSDNYVVLPVTIGTGQSLFLTALGLGPTDYRGFFNSIEIVPASVVGTTTTVARTGGSNNDVYGSSETFTATVVPASGTLGTNGTIAFYVNGVAAAAFPVTGSGNNGVATFTTSALPVNGGTPDIITASFFGAMGFAASLDATGVSQTMTPLTVRLSGSKVYDGLATVAAADLNITNSVGGDDVFCASGVANLSGAAVGTQTITSPGTLALGGTRAWNYTLSGLSGTVRVDPSPYDAPWVANISLVALAGGVPALGGIYSSNGVMGTGTYWNIVTNTYNSSALVVRTNTTAFSDDGTANRRFSFSINEAYTYAYGTVNQLLDNYVQCWGTTPFSFTNLPNGTYDLAFYSSAAEYSVGDDATATLFMVNGQSNWSQTLTASNGVVTSNSRFVEGGNYVRFRSLTVTNHSLSGTYAPGGTSGHGYICGLQLQYNGTNNTVPFVSSPSPASLTVVRSQSAQLSAAAWGCPVPGVVWQFSPSGGPPWANVTNTTTVSGASTPILAFTNIQLAQSGYYHLVATNAAGAATSSPPAQLTVVPVSVSSPSPGSFKLGLGQQTQFSAAVLGYPAPGMFWQFTASTNGNPSWTNLVSGPACSGTSSNVLTLPNVQLAQAGFYRLVATNVDGAATCAPPAQLLVYTNSGMTYYVSTNGNDSNSGKSWAQAWRTIGHAVGGRVPGDVICLAGGQTFAEAVSIVSWMYPASFGVLGLPLTLTSDPANPATIQQAGTGNGVYIDGKSYITVQNLKLLGLGLADNTNKAGTGVFALASGGKTVAGITVSNVTVSGFGSGFAFWANDAISLVQDVLLVNSRASSNFNGGGTWAASLGGVSNVVVRGCEFDHNFGDPNQTKSPSGSGFAMGWATDSVIERCVAHHNGGLGGNLAAGPVGLWCYDSRRITVQYCEAYSNSAAGQDGDGFDVENGTSDSVFQYLYSHDNYGAGILLCTGDPWSNNIVRYCICQNNGHTGAYGEMSFFNGSGPMVQGQVYNNTFYGMKRPAINMSSGSYPISVFLRNNLLITTNNVPVIDGPAPATNQFLFQGNDYWILGGTNTMKVPSGTGYYTNLSSWQTASGQEILFGTNVGYNVNPLLVIPGGGGTIGNAYALTNLTAYQLRTNSPMIGAALNLALLFGLDPGTNDFFGSPTPQNGSYDLGAAEFLVAGGAVATTTAVTSSANPSVFGQSVTFTATLASGSGQVPPTGAVQFKVDGVPLGSAVTATNAGGLNSAAVIASSALAVAGSPHVISAEFTGTGTFLNSTNTLAGGQAVVYAAPVVTNSTWVAGSGFQLTFSGPVGQPFRVLGTNLLMAPLSTWPVLTNGVFGPTGVGTYLDVNSGSQSQSYYRVVSP